MKDAQVLAGPVGMPVSVTMSRALLAGFVASVSIVDSPSHRPTGDDVWAVPSAERGAARGMLFGLGLGVVFGTIGALLSSVTGAQGLGLNPLAIVVAIALTGAAFGAMAGSLSRA